MVEAGNPIRDTAIERGRIAQWVIDNSRLAPFLLFAFILGVTALIILAIERSERSEEETLMREAAHDVSVEVNRRVSTHVSFLRAGAALFTVLEQVNEATFATFVSELPLDDDPVGAKGIGWAEVMKPDAVADFEARTGIPVSARFNSEKELEGNAADKLVVVSFLEPKTQANLRTVGYDLYSDPTRREAIEKATRSAKPTASGKLQRKFREPGRGAGFLILVPVFDASMPDQPATGFVFSPFAAEEVIANALASPAVTGLNIRLYDGEPIAENILATSQSADVEGRKLREEVMIADQLLTVEVESTRGNSLSILSIETLMFGLVVASLLSLLLRILTQRAIEDQASLERLEAENSIRNTLTRELNHRVKNTLANVLSIISLTRRRSGDLDGFADSLEGRIRALSATHDLLTNSSWSETPLRAILEAEIGVQFNSGDGAISLDGPPVHLAPNDALSFGMAIHELTTNARRYGALSQPGGHVRVTWQLVGEGKVRVEWCESGGPRVADLRQSGFGTELIEKVVAHELSHNVDLEFNADGVRCVLQVPVRLRPEFAMREAPSISKF